MLRWLSRVGRFVALIALQYMAALCAGQAAIGRCNEIRIYASVMNDRGNVIAGLNKDNFAAEISGKPAQITSVQYRSEGQRLALLIDDSSSMDGPRRQVSQAAITTLTSQIPQSVPIAVIAFDSTVHRLVPLTTDRKQIGESLQRFFSAREAKATRRTSLLDGIAEAVSSLIPSEPGNLIFVVTDGGDNASRIDRKKLEQRLINSRTRLFALLVSAPIPLSVVTPEEREGEETMEQMVEHTGGVFARFPVAGPEGRGHLTQKEFVGLSEASSWVVSNMLDNYDLKLVPQQAISGEAKLKLKVMTARLHAKLRVIAPAAAGVNCP